MAKQAGRTVVLADFNAANFAASLTADAALPQLVATTRAIGDLSVPASDPGPAGSLDDVAIVWTRPEGISAAFAGLVREGTVVLDDVLADVDQFAARLDELRERVSRVVVMTWSTPRVGAAFAGLAMREGVGIANVVMRMNVRLAERVDAMTGVVLLDASGWIEGERTPEEAKLWYAAKVPFRSEVFRRATRQIKSVLRATRGGSRKLIVVDLDDTLWGGLVGEVGWPSLRLGGHDPGGEAYADFQRTLLALARRGILLGIVSKNEESVAMEAIASHPEMVLRPSHFSGWRINWDDKAANIAALTKELNLGLESVVFLDDSAAERGRVREALPDVLVPDWPSSPMLYVDALLSLGCFDMVALTDEDRSRSALYASERERAADRSDTESVGDWLRRLNLRVEVEEINARNLPRAVQLLNKTNQMNLSTRRMDAAELTSWLTNGVRRLWTFRVSDRFGDAGLTGVTSVDVEGARATLVDFVLSCRVFGRRIEEAMLHVATQAARDAGARDFVAVFAPTAKNTPCFRFLEDSLLARDDGGRFHWDLAKVYPAPPEIALQTGVASIS